MAPVGGASMERSISCGSPEGTELRLPALVHPAELLELVLVTLGGRPDAATKWFLYWAWKVNAKREVTGERQRERERERERGRSDSPGRPASWPTYDPP